MSDSALAFVVAGTAAFGFLRWRHFCSADLDLTRGTLWMRRLRPLDVMAARNKVMATKESVEHGRSFRPVSSDVFVVTYPKCGCVRPVALCLRALRLALPCAL